jgi:hypothetical protein
MPLVVFGALGAVGGVVLVRVILREARRINAELAEIRGRAAGPAAHPTLRRDPASGEYRVK